MKKVTIPFEIMIHNSHYIGNATLFSSFEAGKKEMHKKFEGINIRCKLIGVLGYRIYLVSSPTTDYEYFAVLN